jgi:hypothetical protein
MIMLYIGARGEVVGWGTIVGSIPDEAIGFFSWFNPSSRTMACNERPARKADNFTAICEPIV